MTGQLYSQARCVMPAAAQSSVWGSSAYWKQCFPLPLIHSEGRLNDWSWIFQESA